jgi:hypothetical protein
VGPGIGAGAAVGVGIGAPVDLTEGAANGEKLLSSTMVSAQHRVSYTLVLIVMLRHVPIQPALKLEP